MDAERLDELTEALARIRQGAEADPVSAMLPVPHAEAVRLLADRGLIDSVSGTTARALGEALQAVVIGTRLDAIYAEHPEARPSEEEVAQMAQRAGVVHS